jgi:hypothetical protein
MAEPTSPNGGGVDHPQWIKDEAEAISKQGFVDSGNGVMAVRALVPEAKSTHAKIEKLMAEGVPEEEAKERAVADTVREIDGKPKDYPDVAAYVRDQKKNNDGEKIAINGPMAEEMRGLLSKCFIKSGDYIRVESTELRFEGQLKGLGFTDVVRSGLVKCTQDGRDFTKVMYWLCDNILGGRKAREAEKAQKRTNEFEF